LELRELRQCGVDKTTLSTYVAADGLELSPLSRHTKRSVKCVLSIRLSAWTRGDSSFQPAPSSRLRIMSEPIMVELE